MFISRDCKKIIFVTAVFYVNGASPFQASERDMEIMKKHNPWIDQAMFDRSSDEYKKYYVDYAYEREADKQRSAERDRIMLAQEARNDAIRRGNEAFEGWVSKLFVALIISVAISNVIFYEAIRFFEYLRKKNQLKKVRGRLAKEAKNA